MIRVAIVDNDQMLLGATGDWWLRQGGAPVQVTAKARSVAEFLALQAAQRPRIVLLDVVLRDGTHVAQNVATLVEAGHSVIAMSSENHDGRIVRAMQAGAFCYVHKAQDPKELVEAILAAAEGSSFASREELAALLAAETMIDPAPREREAVELYISGMRAAEVASRMHLSVTTIDGYLKRVKERFARTGRPVGDRTALRTEMVRDGLIMGE